MEHRQKVDTTTQTASSMILKTVFQWEPKVHFYILKQETHIFSFSSAVLN